MSLVSPGVQVSITDESFFSSSGPGTVPLIMIATKQDKLTPDGSGIAPGTTAANADSLYLISSQRELLQTFGDPDFNEIGGTAQNGYPLNEYGLLAAYSYLGAANRAYVVRADIDLNDLEPTSVKPTTSPADGTYWFNTAGIVPGLFAYSSGGEWVAVSSIDVIIAAEDADIITDADVEPSSGYQNGDYIMNVMFDGSAADTTPSELVTFKYMIREGGEWKDLDQASPDFQWAPHTAEPEFTSAGTPTALSTGDLWLKTTTPNNGLDIDLSQWSDSLGQWVSIEVPVENNHASYYTSVGGSNAVAADTVVAFVDPTDSYTGGVSPPYQPQVGAQAQVHIEAHNGATTNVVTGSAPVTVGTITNDTPTTFDINGTTGPDLAGLTLDGAIIALNGDVALTGESIIASKSDTDQLVLTASDGRDIVLSAFTASISTELFLTEGTTSNFAPLTSFEAAATAPTDAVADGTYWYDPSFTVDLLVNSGTGIWDDVAGTVSIQSDEPTSPTNGDVWVETDNVAEYPVIYRRTAGAWVLVDNADQTTSSGIVFADARAAAVTAGSGNGVNNGAQVGDPDLDSDRPDPLLYPGGTLLWNTRYSGRNVKVYNSTTSRWDSASGNAADGSLVTGQDAQKSVVTTKLGEILIGNEQLRDDTIFFNLIATPGFPELIDEMVTLNVDRKEQAFVIGDAPFNLSNSTTALQAWSSNSAGAAGNGEDGLVTADTYLGVYYPSGLSTNVDGNEVVVPASHMVLRVMAQNDQTAYPWYAPAGFSRGTVTNATSVGYLNSSDEFVPVSLTQGQRDVLQQNNVNPIANIPNRGLVVFGQKTRQATSSALDRVNVARLVNYIRFQADQLAQPFLFEPNDTVTRGVVKDAFDSFLSELVTLRGLNDFLVVVDESNNTPARIDNNELWIDIAIQPIKSVEFIFLPIRIRNTGDDLNL